MFRNYILVTVRAFRKHKLYSFLNVFGLALGLTVVILIGLFVRFELSYDKFNEKADRTYKIIQEQKNNVYLGSNQFAVTPAPLERALVDELSYVETATTINKMKAMVRTGPSAFYSNGIFATPTFLDVFDFELPQGDPVSALDQPNALLITPELATTVFGTTDVVGRTLELGYWNDTMAATIVGVINAPPANTHFDFDFVLSYVGNEEHENGEWGNNSYHTYVVLRSSNDEGRFGTDLQELVARNMAELSWIKEGRSQVPEMIAQPLTDIHLKSRANFGLADGGDIRYVWLLMLAAGIIMLTACINYMNLATARAATRSREVGVRKVSGAGKLQLIRQFMGESVFVSLVATALAVSLSILLLPAFNTLVEREIPSVLLSSFPFAGSVLVLGIVVGLLSGSYPALVLSRIVPARILKSGGNSYKSKSVLRNALVITQFAIGVVLVFGTLVVKNQLAYIRQADTGIDRERVLAVSVRDFSLGNQWSAIREELSSVEGVVGITATNDLPTDISSTNRISDWDGHEGEEQATLYRATVNHDFVDLLGLTIVEGRDFSAEYSTDALRGVLINETAKRQLGWNTAVGKHMDLGPDGSVVVGVVEDFQFLSARLEIMPLFIDLETDVIRNILLKLRPDDVSRTVEGVGEVMARFAPAYPYEYEFLDDAYNSMYRVEQRLGVVFSIVTGLALIIACLGLFGLAAFIALQRTKEIGVRKALGAGLQDIVLLLSRDFGKLVVIAFVIGSPIAYFVMQRWLGQFAFRIDVGFTVFLASGLLITTVALLTVGYHSIKASMMDPVKALRYE